jgi:hypothetical protein
LSGTNPSDRRLRFERCEDRRVLAFFVTNLDDAQANTPEAEGTLRQAIFDANQFDDVDEIVFDPTLNDGTIILTEGELSISQAVTIDASMLAEGITIDASGNSSGTSVLRIQVSVSFMEIKEVLLKNLTLTGGDSGSGGAIHFESLDPREPTEFAKLTLEDCMLIDNHASSGGGLWAESGVVELTRTIVSDNSAISFGGGIFLRDVLSATFSNSQLLRNEAANEGGGLWGSLSRAGESLIKFENSLVQLNKVTDSGGFGGGLWIDVHGHNSLPSLPKLEVVNTQIIDNQATEDGGGAYIETKHPSVLHIGESSIIGNRAGFESQTGRGGGLFITNEPFAADSHLTARIEQTTISGNSAPVEGGGVWIGINSTQFPTQGDLDASLDFVTIHNNFAPDGGGLFSHDDARVSTTLRNTIVSGNKETSSGSVWDNVAGEIENASSYNLFGTSPATLPTTNNILNNDAPGLRPLVSSTDAPARNSSVRSPWATCTC